MARILLSMDPRSVAEIVARSDESALVCEDRSLAQQSFAEDADINTIAKRFGLTGELPHGVRRPMYGDFTGITDYRQALDALAEAEDSFMQMPADVRASFDNDPEKFVDYCNLRDDKGQLVYEKQLLKLGLVEPAVAVERPKTVPSEQTVVPAASGVAPVVAAPVPPVTQVSS